IKESHLETGTVVRHLAYIGNSEVGANVNFGATAVTANYDGAQKQQTKIGARTRVGAGAVLIAPTTIGHDVIVGPGAVVTRDQTIPDGQTIVGMPAHPIKKDR